MITAELVITGLGTLTVLLFGIVLANFKTRVDKSETETKEIKTNYNEKFDRVHEKLDMIVDKQSKLLLAVEKQTLYCEMVQENKIK